MQGRLYTLYVRTWVLSWDFKGVAPYVPKSFDDFAARI